MSPTYRRYHTYLKILAGLDVLPQSISSLIPRSTRYGWRGMTQQKFWGPLPDDSIDSEIVLRLHAENQLLRKYLWIAFRVIYIYRELVKVRGFRSSDFTAIQRPLERLLMCCRHYGLYGKVWLYLPFNSRQWVSWRNRRPCLNRLSGLCPKRHPHQLTIRETDLIREACQSTRFTEWPLGSVYYQLRREGKLYCCKSTFYKYCRLLGIPRRQVRKPKRCIPLAAVSPLAILHQDITIFRTLNGVKHYLYVIRDNYSRAILACRVAIRYSSEVARNTLVEVVDKYDLMNGSGELITDNGSENKGMLKDWISGCGGRWRQLIAQVDIRQSNSMVEAANKLLKYRYLFPKPIMDTSELTKTIEQALESYNNMPNAQLHGLTPNEVLQGALPDRHAFRAQIREAKKNRVVQNQRGECSEVCQV